MNGCKLALFQITPHGQKIEGSTQTGIHALFPKCFGPFLWYAELQVPNALASFISAWLVAFEIELHE